MYKILFSVCIAAFACASSLRAADEKPTNLVKLEAFVPQLNRLAGEETNPAKIAYIQKVLSHVQEVVNNGKFLTSKDVEVALKGVKSVEENLKRRGHWSSSSSSSSNCEACSELSELDSEFHECCTDVLELLSEVRELIDVDFPCDNWIAIDHVPFAITNSGKYCVSRNLVYNGPGSAITVTADNVTINFHNNTLTLNDPNADGIYVQYQNEFTLLNDSIEGPGATNGADGAAIRLLNVNKAHIDNVYTYKTVHGVVVDSCNDVVIENSLLQGHRGLFDSESTYGTGVTIYASVGVSMNNLVFEGYSGSPVEREYTSGLFVYGDSSNISVDKSVFANWTEALYVRQVSGLIVDECMAIASPYSDLSIVQLGDYDREEFTANDVIIKNSTFEQHRAMPGFDGLLFVQGSGAILENVVVDVDSSEADLYTAGAIHIGCGSTNGCNDLFLAYTNIYARDCIVRGNNHYGLYVETGEDITFSHSQFTGARVSNVFFGGFTGDFGGATHCQILDSLITDSQGNGVTMDARSYEDAIVNCQISDNSGAGVFIATLAGNHHIRNNRIFNNDIGINNQEVLTNIFFNTSCNNSSDNCLGVDPGVVQDPGATPLVAGSNVCCPILD
ncbi:MAG: right-handed parallel beta-helix repeat-containing protein [Verrucomicrobia bacterium]|nr:right-handed parallel beta-helix repeat-containing protein [Verrucomicrobiota bacterium]MBS0636647.1 right-handed parallel beta-helix repeat-containing protein [Verrucomicrobiota bacterium]